MKTWLDYEAPKQIETLGAVEASGETVPKKDAEKKAWLWGAIGVAVGAVAMHFRMADGGGAMKSNPKPFYMMSLEEKAALAGVPVVHRLPEGWEYKTRFAKTDTVDVKESWGTYYVSAYRRDGSIYYSVAIPDAKNRVDAVKKAEVKMRDFRKAYGRFGEGR